ncbi:hypothetical protein KMB85_gp26 [Escherichia phage vB_EcoS_W011D]|uniref:Uncharacterized protein n=1 Tax=Escherichia phage vB_EcoS_W011D TaxID=2575323 RepID=A0A4Y5NR58_9CAUD|nr:hypothetical protein KMB85_gp26 [Escherichia phage vB_EcoS_W011D]QCW18475.1 hypothetical protein vBEcoSW011D_26 [Escherichia phage vB_EcoS_W011D]
MWGYYTATPISCFSNSCYYAPLTMIAMTMLLMIMIAAKTII